MSCSAYLSEIEREWRSGRATERTFYPALKALLEAQGMGIAATIEPSRIQAGAPDFVVVGAGATAGYLEAKDLDASLDEAERTEQLRRYLRSLANLVLTNFLEFRWYVDGEHRRTARLARLTAGDGLRRDRQGTAEVEALLHDFLAHAPEPVESPAELAQRMARLTHIIRDTVIEAFERGQPSDMLRGLRRAFARTLLPDLDRPENVSQFADMYAQTVAYGLFAARVNHQGPEPFHRYHAAREIPRTNPFLRRLFDAITGVDMDEEPYVPFVDDLAHLLDQAHMDRILAHFGRRTRQEDPVVHFYETFLAAYDPRLREMRGVYYTPEPVVSYIVRSVDHLLKERFGLPDGLADTAPVQYDHQVTENGEPRTVRRSAPKVLVLDPACGTGTFLYAAVDLIRERYMERGNAGMWSGYVREQLLRRLFGFELLMAPYAVAHLKLGMQLAGQDLPEPLRAEWAYDFGSEERLGVYLTNTLEEAERQVESLFGPYRAISDEANAAAEVKRDLPIMVIIGNPPYSGHSANKGDWIDGLLKGRLPDGTEVPSYYQVDGQPLGERNPKWLQDDYVKFIRWAQWRIEQTGAGVLAFISNHGYLDNPTFRGMRQCLMGTFSDIYVLDLHGNAKKREVSPDGSPDHNVFDIQQGVAIGIFVKEPGREGPATVHHAELWGTREGKYAALWENEAATTEWRQLQPQSPYYLFTPQDIDLLGEYQAGWKLTEAMPVNVLGFQTHRDHFAIAFDEEEMRHRISDLRNEDYTDDELSQRYHLEDSSTWVLSRARAQLRADQSWQRWVGICMYRPFDWRTGYFSAAVMDRPRRELLDHVFGRDNLCLNTVRQTRAQCWRHALVSRVPAPAVCVEVKDGSSVFALYLYPPSHTSPSQHQMSLNDSPWPAGPGGRTPNLDPRFVADLETGVGLSFVPDGSGDLVATFGPEDVFHYVYAVLHSPTYRDRYAEFLKIDFPRIPLTSDADLFRQLCRLGAELVGLHLLEAGALAHPFTTFPVPGTNEVARGYPRYLAPGEPEPGSGRPLERGRVYINPDQYFRDVPPEVWEFHVGGYRVCEKWLKDRRGRRLSFEDLQHYQKVIMALGETVRLMEEVDAAIPEWPIG
ncbi:MAG: DNA methyltransferase [Anaerolineae bacterium]|nr:DNA methyltransferase [Anaerolineae bacterium]